MLRIVQCFVPVPPWNGSPLLTSLNFRSGGSRLTHTKAEVGLLAFKQKKSGSQALRNTSEPFFFLNMYGTRQDILRLNSMHL